MSRRELIMLIAVGTIGVLLLSYFYVYAPLKARRQQLEAQLADLQLQHKRMDDIVRQMPALRAEFARLQAFIAEIEAKLPAEKDMAPLLVQLERLARSLGISLNSIRPGQLTAATAPAPGQPGALPPPPGAPPAAPSPAAAQTYMRFPIQLAITASYEQLIRLATAMNEFPRMIVILNLAVQPSELPQLSLNVDTETYVLPKGAR